MGFFIDATYDQFCTSEFFLSHCVNLHVLSYLNTDIITHYTLLAMTKLTFKNIIISLLILSVLSYSIYVLLTMNSHIYPY